MTPSSQRLDGKVALITGSGRGMGRSHAVLMAERGADIIVHDIDAANAAETASLVRAKGRKASVIVVDGTDIAAFTAKIAEAEKAHGRVDILVNNAGIQGNKLTVDQIDETIWDAMVDIKMKASFFAVKTVVPGMKARRYGKIVNISSNFALEGWFNTSHYVGAATAMLGYTRAWAREFAPFRITVNAVAPALIVTDLTINSMGWESIKAVEKIVPLGRLGDKMDIAYAVAWLASPETDFMTGQVLSPNGGQTVVGI
ncbi:MAG: SDR family oxidoreductase [Alphaproteobacteria bacterium]|nr:SDR family oxidoreductase [Alphaproteobacteria bacterium]